MSTTAAVTCPKCGGIMRRDRRACPGCGAARTTTVIKPFEPAGVTTPAPRSEDITIEIQSRVMWGDDPDGIRNDLLKQGARPTEVEALLRSALLHRKDVYRALGRKNAIIGAALLALGGAAMLSVGVFFGGVDSTSIGFLIAGIALPVAGILLIAKGVRRIRRPGEGETTAHG